MESSGLFEHLNQLKLIKLTEAVQLHSVTLIGDLESSLLLPQLFSELPRPSPLDWVRPFHSMRQSSKFHPRDPLSGSNPHFCLYFKLNVRCKA